MTGWAHHIDREWLNTFERLTHDRTGWLGWAGDVLIVAGGVTAYFWHPAWLALSVMGLSFKLEHLDFITRASVIASTAAILELSKQIEQR